MTRTWLVTGANRGIGLEYVRQLAAAGQRVIATARDLQAAEPLGPLLPTGSEVVGMQRRPAVKLIEALPLDDG